MGANELSCKDLMTGDYVRHKKTKDIIWIFEIDNDRKVINNEPDGYCSERNISINDVEPIPLTPEILEKNGFERAPQVSDIEPFDTDEEGNKHYSYNKTFWGWFQPGNIFCIPANGMGWLYLKYVHQLQHALRLCGIEKEIIL